MRIARVIGNVVSTVKDEALAGHKLLVIQPLSRSQKSQVKPLIALDAVGAGVGELVYYCRGKEASFPWLPAEIPTDTSIVGILDPASNASAAALFGPSPTQSK